MIMQDKNNLQIADLILQWINERVSHLTRVSRRHGRMASGSVFHYAGAGS